MLRWGSTDAEKGMKPVAEDAVLGFFDQKQTYTVHWIDDLITTQHQIVGARTDKDNRPWALLACDPITGSRTILNWDKIASIEEEAAARP